MLEVFSIAVSLVSVALAVFAVWFANEQRKESQLSAEKARDLLAKIDERSSKTEILVSDNYQRLLDTVTEQQGRMLDSLKPKRSSDELGLELFVDLLGRNPAQAESLLNTMLRINDSKSIGVRRDSMSPLSSSVLEVKPSEDRKDVSQAMR